MSGLPKDMKVKLFGMKCNLKIEYLRVILVMFAKSARTELSVKVLSVTFKVQTIQ